MIRRIFPVFALVFAALAMLGCASNDPGKRYALQGEVKALDPTAKTATIAAGKIEGWMEAMTMEYAVKPDAEFAKLHVGDHINAIVVVKDSGYYVTDVKVGNQ